MELKELVGDDLQKQAYFLRKLLMIVNNQLREQKDRDISTESNVLLAMTVVDSISVKLKLLAEM